jgi:hypothetical protein
MRPPASRRWTEAATAIMLLTMRQPATNSGLFPGLIMLSLLGFPVSGCGTGGPVEPHQMPATLLVAVDGLAWEQLLPAMDAGSTPNLLDLARRGSAVRLVGGSHPSATAMWSAMSSGRMQPEPGSPDLWQILEDAGHSTGKAGWSDADPTVASPVWQRAEEIITGHHPRLLAVRQRPASGDAAPSPQASELALIDAGIGRLRGLMPPETDVIVVSGQLLIAAGPSFRAPKPRFHLPEDSDRLPLAGSQEIAGILHIMPSLLHLRHQPLPTGLEGSVLDDLLVEGSN